MRESPSICGLARRRVQDRALVIPDVLTIPALTACVISADRYSVICATGRAYELPVTGDAALVHLVVLGFHGVHSSIDARIDSISGYARLQSLLLGCSPDVTFCYILGHWVPISCKSIVINEV